MFTSLKRHNKTRIEFQVKNTDLAVINALRRIGICEIPNVALDVDITKAHHPDATIHTNTTPLNNEFLLHRISLIPFCFSEDEIENFDPTKYTFKLAAKNTSNKTQLITSGDITLQDHPHSLQERVFPKNPITGDHILITKLKPGEEIDIQFKLSKGIAKTHARWCPLSQCTYTYTDDKDPTYTFKIQSECAMRPEYIVKKALDILIQKVTTFRDTHSKDPKNIQEIAPEFFDVTIPNEDYTLANVLQSCIYNKAIKAGDDKRLTYIAYYHAHPFLQSINLKLKMSNTKSTDLPAFFEGQSNKIIQDLEAMKLSFEKILQ